MIFGAKLMQGSVPGPQTLALMAAVMFGFYLCFRELQRLSDELSATRAQFMDALTYLGAGDAAPPGPQPQAKRPAGGQAGGQRTAPARDAGEAPPAGAGEESELKAFALGPAGESVAVKDPALRRLLFDEPAGTAEEPLAAAVVRAGAAVRLGGEEPGAGAGGEEAAGKAGEAAAGGEEAAGRAGEAAAGGEEPAAGGEEPAGKAGEPAGKAGDPAGKAGDPAAKAAGKRKGPTLRARKSV